MLTALALLELMFLVVTFFGAARSLIGPDPYAMFVLISTNIAFLAVWIGIKLTVQDGIWKHRFDDVVLALKDVAKSRPGITTLVDHDFYYRFGKAMGDATAGVAITHLDTYPPNRNKKTPAADYYSNFNKTIRANARTHFRRVERASAEKRDWLQNLINDFDGIGNFSLGVLLLPTKDRRCGLVSVQLIDDSDVVLVAVAEHDSSLGVRDIWIADPATASLWRHYFEDILWRPTAKVVENGKLNQSEWKRVTDYIERR